MGKLIYASNMSLDGWTEDADGGFNWAPPDEDVFMLITGIMRSVGTYLYGRRMYETMAVWETDPTLGARSELTREFANGWQVPDKVVYSKSLESVPTAKTRIEREFDADAVRELKAASKHDLLVGGPRLAAQAFQAGLVDECHLFIWPDILGGKNPALPTQTRVKLELVEERRVGRGVLYVRYRAV